MDSPEAAAEVARVLADQQQSVIAVSGPTDHITDGERMVRLSNGHPWLTRVTGVGCALGALMAAFAAVVPDAVVAAAAATATLTVAADSAAEQARGPGQLCGRPAGRARPDRARRPGRPGEDQLSMRRPPLDLSIYLASGSVFGRIAGYQAASTS